MQEDLKTIRDLELKGRATFIRVDFNVPLDTDQDPITVTDTNRIEEAIPTIRYAMDQGAKVVLASHLGRPKGNRNPKFSLQPVAAELARILQKDVPLTDECVGDGIEMMVKSMKEGELLLLENLRFYKEETENNEHFCNQLARLTDVYINDAFGTSHRKHASTYGLPSLMSKKGVGFLIEKEIRYLDPLLHSPAKPFYTILGGAKVSDKIKSIESLLRHVDGILVGGAMAYAFYEAQGRELPEGAKKPAPEDVIAAKSILQYTKKREIEVLLPVDTVDSFDIGPKSIEVFQKKLQNAKTIFWNGPLGWFEKPEYAKATRAIAQFLSQIEAVKIVGGGDSVAAIRSMGLGEKFDHLSTGGGAVLEYLEKGKLPGIEILKQKPSQRTQPYLVPEEVD